MANGFTPTETAMLIVLADGRRHSRQELHACLQDDLAPLSAIYFHITKLRSKLNPIGEHIVCETANRQIFYRHVKLLAPPKKLRGATKP